MLLFYLVLIFALIFHDIWQISVGQVIKSYIWNMFYVHAKCKFLIFKFSKVMQQHISGVVGSLILVVVANLVLFAAVKELWKSMENLQSYSHG